MTALTPQQMRELAVTHFPHAGSREREIIAALRAAADQLEAVQELHRWLRKNIGSPALHDRLDQFAADTTPREDRDA